MSLVLCGILRGYSSDRNTDVNQLFAGFTPFDMHKITTQLFKG